MIKELIVSIAFVFVIAGMNAYVSLQLQTMKYINDASKTLGEIRKGVWHIYCGLARLMYAITIGFLDVKYAVVYVLLDFSFYDAVLNKMRGLPFWRFAGTCENWGEGFDFDCIWMKIQNFTRVPLTLLKVLVSAAVYYWVAL